MGTVSVSRIITLFFLLSVSVVNADYSLRGQNPLFEEQVKETVTDSNDGEDNGEDSCLTMYAACGSEAECKSDCCSHVPLNLFGTYLCGRGKSLEPAVHADNSFLGKNPLFDEQVKETVTESNDGEDNGEDSCLSMYSACGSEAECKSDCCSHVPLNLFGTYLCGRGK